MLRRISLLAAAMLLTGLAIRTRLRTDVTHDWLQFGDPVVFSETPATAISAATVNQLAPLWRSALPEPCDGTPLFVSSVMTRDSVRNLLIVETMAGRLVALDASEGSIVWQTEPPAGPRWTTSSPAVDPSRQYVFAYGLDGYVHRYEVATGQEVTGHGFPELITLKGEVEKGSSNLSIATARDGETYLYMTTSAYPDPGDAGDYQGHLVTINLRSGEQHVFNVLCSDRTIHFSESGGADDCSSVQAGVWARAGAVYDPETDRLFITTGNGSFDADRGGYDWGSSVLALRADGVAEGGTPIDSYTPLNYQEITDDDLDLSSTTIEPLPVSGSSDWPRLGVQSGKDSKLRLLNLEDLSGLSGPRHLGGELEIVDLPQGGEVLTQPVAWLEPATQQTWVFVSDNQGTVAYGLTDDGEGDPMLVQRWTSNVPGTTPILTNGVLYLASPHQIAALRPTDGTLLWSDQSIGDTHWQSAIVVGNALYLSDNGSAVTAWSLVRGPRRQ